MRQYAKLFLVKYKDAISIGFLAGILVTNFWMLSNQGKTLNEVRGITGQIQQQQAADAKQREEIRQEDEERQQRLVNHIDCLVRLFVETKDRQVQLQSIDSCSYTFVDSGGDLLFRQPASSQGGEQAPSGEAPDFLDDQGEDETPEPSTLQRVGSFVDRNVLTPIANLLYSVWEALTP